jgi:hypothetical protein
MVPFTGDRGFESLFIEGAVPPKLSALAALASSIRETLAGFAGFVRPCRAAGEVPLQWGPG